MIYEGPFDREAWPERLVAHVVEPGPVPRLHGYSAADLARTAPIGDVVWLALTGELPTPAQRAALDVAVALLAPIDIGEAPSHAAFLAGIAAAPPGATLAIATVGLGELAGHEQRELAPWLRYLDEPTGELPAIAREPAPTDASRALQAWLHARLEQWFGRGLPEAPLHRVALAYAVLHHLALATPLAVATITVLARLPAIAAEAGHARPGAVRSYPARLPDYQYVDADGATP